VFQAIEPFFGGHAITPLCTGVRQLLGGGICADRRRVGAFDDTRRMPTPEAKSRCVCRCPAIGRIRLAITSGAFYVLGAYVGKSFRSPIPLTVRVRRVLPPAVRAGGWRPLSGDQ
jgi:hypothetical protein